MKNKFILFILSFLFTNTLLSQNLILNPGFEAGGSGVGFVINGIGYSLLNPITGTSLPGNFAFSSNPNLVNTTDFLAGGDHTSGNGRMLVIDGNTTAGNPKFWKAGNAGGGATGLTVGATYRFSYWIKSVSSLVTGPSSQADIGVQIAGVTPTLVAGTTLAPLPALGWRHVVYSFTATTATTTIELWNNNLNSVGNDFAVDDFVLTKDLMVSYSVTDALCVTPDDGSIIVNGFGGVAPYVNYTITGPGPVTQNNATGIFPNIPPGIYTVSVRDSATPAVTVLMGNVVVGPSLTLNNAATICLGSSINLSAAGSSNTYSWTAVPVDPSLTTPAIANPIVSPIITTVYTASSSIGVCSVTKSVTITVNPTPTTTFTGNITICPGNTSTITMTGSPLSTVTFFDNSTPVNIYTRIIPLSGTTIWTSPVLNITKIYTLQSIRNNSSPFCQTNYPVGTAATVTITVVPNGCATVATIAAPGTPPLELTLCTAGECRTLEANVSQVPSTTSYAVSSIPYCPQAAFENPSWINIGPGTTFGDDDWSDGFSFPAGMNFCFYGQNYTQLNVGTNGVIRFPNPNLFIGGDNCPWAYTQTIPNAGFPITNAIFGVYQDIDFSVTPPAGVQISVNYQVVGSYPCRKFIANFTNVPQFSCGNTIGLSTSQIVLYEVSNIIEVYVQRRTACTGWNGGRGTIGVINSTGLQAVAPTGRNAVPFSTDPTPNNSTNTDNVSEAWRFTPTGTNVSQTINWYQGPATPANFIGTGTTLQVCPTVTTNYTLETVYDVCGVPQKASSPIILNVNPDLTNSPINITQCSNSFNLTVNNNVILGTLTQSDYSITFHTSAAQAAANSNPISNPSAFVSSGQTIYVAIYLNAFGCTVVKSFNLIISCGTISPVPDLRLCESAFGSGTATFDLSPQSVIALGTQISSNYVFFYYTSQAAANAGVLGTDINPINSFLSANQTIYIRMQEVANSSTFFTTNFNLIVNPLPSITGSLIVCEGSSISLSGSGSSASTNPWVSSNPLIATITNLGLISGVSAGTITITYTNSNGCQNSVDVVVNSLPTVVGLSNICIGSTTQLTGSPIAAILNPWVSSDGSVVTITNSGLVTSITAGTTSIIYTNTFGCKKVVSITVDPLPIVTGTLTVCPNLTTQLSGSGSPAAANPWVSFNPLIATITSSGLVTGVSTGTTTITYTTSTGCQRTATITVNALPTITGTLNVCIGLTTQLTGSPTAATTNPWVSSNPLVATINNSGLVTGVSAGTTTITYTNSNGCQRTTTITVNGLPTITGTLNVCVGLTTQLTGSAAPSPTNPWVSSNNSVATIDTTGLVTSITVGTTTITYTNSNGCQITATVTVNSLPTITGTLNACIGLTTQLTGSPTAATTNPWASSNPLVATINNSGLVTGVSPGTTTITYTNSNGCQITATVTVNGLPIITGNLSVCVGLTTQLTGSAAPSSTNPWVSSNTSVATIDTTGLVTSITVGTTTITYTNSNGCQITATVTVNALPTITGTLNVCPGLTTQLSAIGSPAAITPWVSSNPLVATINNTGLVTGVSAGTTTITYTNSNGCQITATVTINGLPAITGTLNACIGLTTQLSTTGSPAAVTPWVSSNPLVATIDNLGLVTGVSAGTTTITYTNSTGCQTTATVTIIGLPAITGTLNVCPGLTTQLSTTGSPAAVTPWVSSNPLVATIDNLGLVTGVSAGTTTITYTNSNGCQNTTLVTVNPLPSVIVPATLFECSNGTVTTATFDLTINQGVVTGGLSGFSVTYYTSLPDAQSGTPSIVSPTSYTGSDNQVVYLRVENTATGCFSITTQLLRVTQGPLAITPLPLHYCDPNNDGFGLFDLDSTINAIAGGSLPAGVSVTFHETPTDALLGANPKTSPYYNIVLNTQTIYVRVFYTLTGCANYVNLQLIVDPTPISPVNLNPITVCDQDTNPQDGITAVDLTQLESAILAQQPQPITSTYTISYYTSQSDAQTPTATPISNVTSYVTASAEIWIRIANNGTTCFNTGSFQVVVNTPLSLTTPLPLSLCDNDFILNDQFQVFDLTLKDFEISGGLGTVTYYPSLLDAQNGTNVITTPTAYQNAPAYPAVQTLGVVVTTSAGCKSITTLDIRVEPLPTLTPPANVIEVCDSNQDGFGDFNLNNLVPGLLNGITTYVVSFHETLTDAQLDVNAINTSISYTTITPLMQMLYVRAEDTITGCWSTLTITLNVNPSPIAPVNLNPITVCDQDATPQDGITAVDLSQQQAAILAQQPQPASTYTISYYTSLLDAQNQTAPIINITSYVTTSREIWVRVEDNTTLSCSNISSFQVVINKPLSLPNSLPPFSLCDYDSNPNNQYHIFNLTQGITTLLPLVTGATVAYYPSLLDAQNGTNVILTPGAYQNALAYPGVQTLGVVVTTAAGCRSITTLDIRVLPIPTPRTNPPALAPKCDDNLPGDMLEVFDLTVNESYIENSDPNLSFHYFQTQADAIANINEIPNPNAALVGGNVWIRVENNRVDYFNNKCYVLVEQPLTVNPLPTVVTPLAPYRACDDNADGITLFNLADPLLTVQVLGTIQLPTDYTVSYYLTAAGANPLTNTGESPLPLSYINTSSPTTQTIYIRVKNNTTGCVNATGVLDLVVEDYAVASGPQEYIECDSYGDLYDGVNQIDLTTYAPAILNGQNPAVFLVSYYTNFADAEAGTNALTLAEAQAYQNDADTDTIWVKVENSSNSITPFCYAITTIDITVERNPNPIINTANNVTTICVDFNSKQVVRSLTLNSGITNPSNYTFEWFEDGSTTPIPGATGPSYTVNTASPTGATRDYTVTVTSNSPLLCQTTSLPFSVIQSGQAVIPAGTDGYTVNSYFSSSQTITVNIEGYGAPDYQYSLDDGPRQTSNVFENVSLGTHVIHVWDSKGDIAYSCEELVIELVKTINYPYYFTPNGDGIHDTWNIVGLADKPGTRIYIFDRYGKLLKQISSTGAGWDGTYNGSQMPSDDYWFTVDYEEGTMKQFKAHFTLKR